MSQWEMVDGKSTEVGLAPHQTSGNVGGTYVERPAGSETSSTYYTEETLKEQNVYRDPETEKRITPDEAIRRGLEGGWQVGDKYYLTERAAKNDIQRMQAIVNIPRASGAATPPEFLYKQKLAKEGYKPNTQDVQEVYVPRFGKMIPAEEYWAQHPTPFMKVGKVFEKYETDISNALDLKSQVIKPLEKWYERGASSLEAMGLKSELRTKKVIEEVASGAAYGIAEKPLTTAGNIAVALLVTKGVGALVSKAPVLATGIGTGRLARQINVVNILGAGLAGMYGIDVAGRYAEAPNKAEFLGRVTSTELIPFAVGGYLGSKKLPIQYENVKTPEGAVLWKGISVGDQPLIGASQQARLVLGKPKPEQIPRFKITEYMPVTKLETNIMARKSVMESFGYSQKEIAKVDIGLKLMRETETQLSKFTESRLLRGTKSMSEKGTDAFLKYVKEQKGVVDKIYGSFGARSQLKPEFRRLPGDIDIQLTTTEAGAIKFTKNLASRLRASGENVRVSKDNPTLIETYGKAGEHHAIDIHYKGEPTTDILTPGDEVSRYGLKLGQKSIKIEGYDIMPLSEHGIRKGSSVLTWRQKEKIAPAAHRLKDVPDFIATQITLIESKYGMIPNKHQELINEWSKLFPEAKGLKGEVQLPLYQSVKSKPSPSMNVGVPVSLKTVTPSRSVSTSAGAKSYQSQYIASISSSVSAISRSLSAVIISSGSPSVRTSAPPISLKGFSKPSNIKLASKILSPQPSKSPPSKTISAPPKSKPTSKYSPYTSPPSTISSPTPRKLPPLKPKDFTDEIDSLSKRKKKRKYVWDIKNPVPTLEQILGR